MGSSASCVSGADFVNSASNAMTCDSAACTASRSMSAKNSSNFPIALLLALLENSDRILTRDSLLDNLHGISNPYDERTIDGLISRVRKKLAIPDSYKPIKTVRNVGYMFCERVHTERH